MQIKVFMIETELQRFEFLTRLGGLNYEHCMIMNSWACKLQKLYDAPAKVAENKPETYVYIFYDGI